MAWWKWTILALLALSGIVIAIAVPAPPPHYHGFHLRLQGLHLISFLLVALYLVWKMGPTVKKYLEARYESVRLELEEAKALHEEARKRFETAEKRLAAIEQEIQSIKDEFRRLGEKERDEMVYEATVMAQKLKEETDFAMSQALKTATMELRAMLVERSIEMVEKRLAARKVGRVPDPLVARFVQEIRGREGSQN